MHHCCQSFDGGYSEGIESPLNDLEEEKRKKNTIHQQILVVGVQNDSRIPMNSYMQNRIKRGYSLGLQH